MAAEAERRLKVSDLSPQVADAEGSVADAVRRLLKRRDPSLAERVEVRPEDRAVLLRAEGDDGSVLLQRAARILTVDPVGEAEGELEVDPADFSIETNPEVLAAAQHEELLRSRVRYLPYPVCEWFEISTGELVVTEAEIVFEPKQQITPEEGTAPSGEHRLPLGQVTEVRRGEWCQVPCLMIETPGRTYRYGWPAERRGLESIFNVDEWIARLRALLQEEP